MGEIDRRTLTRAGVWALPVVALAVAAPAATASGATPAVMTRSDIRDEDGYAKFAIRLLSGAGEPVAQVPILVERLYRGSGRWEDMGWYHTYEDGWTTDVWVSRRTISQVRATVTVEGKTTVAQWPISR